MIIVGLSFHINAFFSTFQRFGQLFTAVIHFSGQLGNLRRQISFKAVFDPQVLFSRSIAQQVISISRCRRQDILIQHIQHRQGFDIDRFGIFFQHDLHPGTHLGRCKNTVFNKQFDIFFRFHIRQRFRCGFKIKKPPRFGLFYPCVRITVTVEHDTFMLDDGFFDQFLHGSIFIGCFF